MCFSKRFFSIPLFFRKERKSFPLRSTDTFPSFSPGSSALLFCPVAEAKRSSEGTTFGIFMGPSMHRKKAAVWRIQRRSLFLIVFFYSEELTCKQGRAKDEDIRDSAMGQKASTLRTPQNKAYQNGQQYLHYIYFYPSTFSFCFSFFRLRSSLFSTPTEARLKIQTPRGLWLRPSP